MPSPDLIIIAVNLIGGITIGTLQHGMSAAEALERYSLLTIGDGLVIADSGALYLDHGRLHRDPGVLRGKQGSGHRHRVAAGE